MTRKKRIFKGLATLVGFLMISSFVKSDVLAECAGVPKTGQTTCYDESGDPPIPCSGTGQDGEYQKGVEWPSPRFTDNGDGTVTDNLTGLIWLKDANCFELRTWTQALSDCNELASGSCELTDGSSAGDWRLPNRFELESLLHLEYYNPAVPNTAGTGKWSEGDPFTNVQNYYYWSSTTRAISPNMAWNVNVSQGLLIYDTLKSTSYYVWPVRGETCTCATPIPTLSEWKLIILTIVIMGIAVMILRRRRMA